MSRSKRLRFSVTPCITAWLVGAGVAVPMAGAQTLTDPNLTVAPYVTGLSSPTGLKFIAPGDVLAIEKNSGRVVRSVGGTSTEVLNLAVANDSERGLLGIEIHPQFATNPYVYLYYSSSTGADGGAWQDNRLVRYTWNGSQLVSPQHLATFGTSADGQANGANHDAGPLRFGPDGKLYGTTGDLNRDRAEQNNGSFANSSAMVGGIYRLNADGTIPTDNPFTASANTDFHRWYSYGVRNTFGLAFDPLTGNLWDTENGPGSYDEINLVSRGSNSGWRDIMGPLSRSGTTTAGLVNLPGSAYSDPEFSWLTPIAPTGMAFLADTLLDADYRDAVIVGANNTGALYLFRLNANRDGLVFTDAGLMDLVADSTAERNLSRWGEDFGAITEILAGPDGAIYLTSYADGTIYRIAPVPEPALGALAMLLLAWGKRPRRCNAGSEAAVGSLNG